MSAVAVAPCPHDDPPHLHPPPQQDPDPLDDHPLHPPRSRSLSASVSHTGPLNPPKSPQLPNEPTHPFFNSNYYETLVGHPLPLPPGLPELSLPLPDGNSPSSGKDRSPSPAPALTTFFPGEKPLLKRHKIPGLKIVTPDGTPSVRGRAALRSALEPRLSSSVPPVGSSPLLNSARGSFGSGSLGTGGRFPQLGGVCVTKLNTGAMFGVGLEGGAGVEGGAEEGSSSRTGAVVPPGSGTSEGQTTIGGAPGPPPPVSFSRGGPFAPHKRLLSPDALQRAIDQNLKAVSSML